MPLTLLRSQPRNIPLESVRSTVILTRAHGICHCGQRLNMEWVGDTRLPALPSGDVVHRAFSCPECGRVWKVHENEEHLLSAELIDRIDLKGGERKTDA